LKKLNQINIMLNNFELQKQILQRVDFMANSGKRFDEVSIALKKHLGIGQKYSYQRIPDKLGHYLYDYIQYLKYGKDVQHIGNAFEAMVSTQGRFEQHPLHRGFYYDKNRHSLVGTATGIDINVSNGKHHILELNRSIGILEKIRPIYNTKYGPEIYNIVNFAKKHKFRKVYVMYSRLHLYRKEILDASAEFNLEMIPVSFPWVEFDKKNYRSYFMPEALERDTLYMRLEPGYSPIMHYISDKFVSYKWLKETVSQNPSEYAQVNIPEATNSFSINVENYSEKWPSLVVKLSGKMQGQAVFMLKADSEEKGMKALNIQHKEQMPPIFKSTFSEIIVDKLFGNDKTVIYQDFVQPSLKDGKAGRIRLNVFANPMQSFSLSDYYMWTVFEAPDKCPDGLLADPRPYIVNWAFSGKKAQFAELTASEREITDPAIPQICKLIQEGLGSKFISQQ
jgi:hypothetical protein